MEHVESTLSHELTLTGFLYCHNMPLQESLLMNNFSQLIAKSCSKLFDGLDCICGHLCLELWKTDFPHNPDSVYLSTKMCIQR